MRLSLFTDKCFSERKERKRNWTAYNKREGERTADSAQIGQRTTKEKESGQIGQHTTKEKESGQIGQRTDRTAYNKRGERTADSGQRTTKEKEGGQIGQRTTKGESVQIRQLTTKEKESGQRTTTEKRELEIIRTRSASNAIQWVVL